MYETKYSQCQDKWLNSPLLRGSLECKVKLSHSNKQENNRINDANFINKYRQIQILM